MMILLNIVKLSANVGKVHPDMNQIEVTSSVGTVLLDVVSSNSSRELVICKPIGSKWKAMLVLAPLVTIGVEVFSNNWE